MQGMEYPRATPTKMTPGRYEGRLRSSSKGTTPVKTPPRKSIAATPTKTPPRKSIAATPTKKLQRIELKEEPSTESEQEDEEPEGLDDVIVGLETQESSLNALFSTFKKKQLGGSCVLSGKSGSGKSALLNKIMKRHFRSSQSKIQVIRIDALVHITPTAALKVLDLDTLMIGKERKGVVIVVDHFEHLTTRKHQNFLYTALNGSQRYPWLVILMSAMEDCIQSLEKRVKSRLSTNRISFNVRMGLDQMTKALLRFIAVCLPEEDSLLETIREDANGLLDTLLRRFSLHHSSIAPIKQMAVLFAATYSTGTETLRAEVMKQPVKLLMMCAEAVFPSDEMTPLAKALPLRQLCLLRSMLLVRKSGKLEFSFRDAIIEYKQLCNRFDSSMAVEDAVLLKDLDELIALSLVVPKRGADLGQSEFRKVQLNVEDETIMRSLLAMQPLPMGVRSWIGG